MSGGAVLFYPQIYLSACTLELHNAAGRSGKTGYFAGTPRRTTGEKLPDILFIETRSLTYHFEGRGQFKFKPVLSDVIGNRPVVIGHFLHAVCPSQITSDCFIPFLWLLDESVVVNF